uniref:MHC class I-like antigen recognition-like domain-containing protein n=1 Tax=Otolemur garnettii TaxID=30611 RepID=H0X835_OTOGA
LPSGQTFLPLLASMLPCAPCRAASRSHSLRYNLTVVSQHGSVSSKFFAEGHLDGERFLLYGKKGRAEPQGPWAKASLGIEVWDTETKDMRENGKDLRMTLAQIIGQKGLGAARHSLQEITECEIHEDNSTSGFRHFYYDGELFLSQNLKTQKQIVPPSSGAHTLAMNIRKVWDEDAMTRPDAVLADCVQKLQRYLDSRMGFSLEELGPRRAYRRPGISEGFRPGGNSGRTQPAPCVSCGGEQGLALGLTASPLPSSVAPTVNVTHSQVLDGYMGHSRNQSTHTVLSGRAGLGLGEQRRNAPRPRSHRLAILCTALVIALAVVYKKRTSAARGPDLVSLHVLDQGQVVTGAHEGTTQLGFQVLLLAPGTTGHTEGT